MSRPQPDVEAEGDRVVLAAKVLEGNDERQRSVRHNNRLVCVVIAVACGTIAALSYLTGFRVGTNVNPQHALPPQYADNSYSNSTGSPCYHFEQMLKSTAEFQTLSYYATRAPRSVTTNFELRCIREEMPVQHEQAAEQTTTALCADITEVLLRSLVPGALESWCDQGFPTQFLDLGQPHHNRTTHKRQRRLFDWGPTLAGFGCASGVIYSAAQGTPTCGQACDSSCGTGGDAFVSG